MYNETLAEYVAASVSMYINQRVLMRMYGNRKKGALLLQEVGLF
jgi:hypothetical protein